jgi:predicted NACHT family NTPase
MRHFAADWYAALVERDAIPRDLGDTQTKTLVDAITGNTRLRAMTENPLLLTMMALVLAEKGELPRDRPLLYERILEQLLGQWDQQKGGESLAEVIGDANLRGDDLRPILDRLSYEAHGGVCSVDGRGRLAAKELRYALASFFETVKVNGAWEAAGRCLAYFNERSGLLLPEDAGEAYAFAHLTLQEHGAGRHMLLQPNAVELVMQRRADDRWREPIALGLGRCRSSTRRWPTGSTAS